MTPMKPGKPLLQSARWLDQVRERMRDLDHRTAYLYRVMAGASKRLLDAGQAEQLIRHPAGKVG